MATTRKAQFDNEVGGASVASRFNPNLDPGGDQSITQQISIVVQARVGFSPTRMAELAHDAINEVMDKAIISDVIGVYEGSVCGRGGCPGIIELEPVDCTCSATSAPCHQCESARWHCPVCQWFDGDPTPDDLGPEDLCGQPSINHPD